MRASRPPPSPERPIRPPQRALPPKRRVSAEALFAGAREVIIEHGGIEYRLRLTRADKLILTK